MTREEPKRHSKTDMDTISKTSAKVAGLNSELLSQEFSAFLSVLLLYHLTSVQIMQFTLNYEFTVQLPCFHKYF